MGVPTLGCDCAVCTSTDPRDRRLRPSVLLRWQEGPRNRAVVVDTGPDFREQALRNSIQRVDAVLYTHGHADHILGLDDLRPLSFIVNRESGPIPLYASPETAAVLERIYDYTFSPKATYPTRARVRIEPMSDQMEIFGVVFVRVPVFHGQQEIAGFRFGRTGGPSAAGVVEGTRTQLTFKLLLTGGNVPEEERECHPKRYRQAEGRAVRVGLGK